MSDTECRVDAAVRISNVTGCVFERLVPRFYALFGDSEIPRKQC